MHRFYLPPEQCAEPELILTERESHHAADVLRIRKDDKVTVLNGAGAVFLCRVLEVARKRVRLSVVEKQMVPPPPCRVTLVQAIPKGKLIEDIIEKATELGVSRIVPLLSSRVATQLDEAAGIQKAEKWQLVATEAIKQCGQAWLPKVEAPLTLVSLLGKNDPFNLSLVGSLEPHSQHPRRYFDDFWNREKRLPESVRIWIGPEGDFTPEEYEAIRASGVSPITLGPLVLRCETAAIYTISIVNYEISSRG